MSEEGEKVKTMEEIAADVLALKATAAANRKPAGALDLGTKVSLNGAAHKKLGKSKGGDRARDDDIVGDVVGYNERQDRILVRWPARGGVPEHIEPIAKTYLEVL